MANSVKDRPAWRRPPFGRFEGSDALLLRGLLAGAQTPLQLPFYSPEIRLPLILIEISGAEHAAAAMRQNLYSP